MSSVGDTNVLMVVVEVGCSPGCCGLDGGVDMLGGGHGMCKVFPESTVPKVKVRELCWGSDVNVYVGNRGRRTATVWRQQTITEHTGTIQAACSNST